LKHLKQQWLDKQRQWCGVVGRSHSLAPTAVVVLHNGAVVTAASLWGDLVEGYVGSSHRPFNMQHKAALDARE
jgi:hypothetical protein